MAEQHLILKMLCNGFLWEVNQAVSFLILHISCLNTGKVAQLKLYKGNDELD